MAEPRRMWFDGVSVEVEYVGDRDDGDYGTVNVAFASEEDDQAVHMTLLVEELPLLVSLLQFAIDDWSRARRCEVSLMREASWVR